VRKHVLHKPSCLNAFGPAPSPQVPSLLANAFGVHLGKAFEIPFRPPIFAGLAGEKILDRVPIDAQDTHRASDGLSRRIIF